MTPITAWNKSIRDSVDELLQKNGYNADASARHQLSMMNFEAEQAQAVAPVAWVFLPNRELLWPAEVEATNPIAIDEYKPLYAHPAPPVQQVAVPQKVGDSRFESWYSELQQAGKGSKQIAREAYEAGLNEAQQVAVPAWVPTAERMPEPCVNVLAYTGKGQPIRAQWVPAKTLEDSGDGDFGEYDEATDQTYWPEAWYETNAHEETHWMVDGQVTHWMPLPAAPQGAKP